MKEAADRGGLISKSWSQQRLLQRAGNAAEGGIQLSAKALNDSDDGNRDTGGDKAIFDSRGTGLIV
jgi:hypothetical protein